MHGVHRNACLMYLFIASNSPVVWEGRHKDISKHKPKPAKSWVVRLISKRWQCSTEAKDPILVITLPPPPSPPRDSRRSCCVRLFEHQFLWACVVATSQCLSPQWLRTDRQVSSKLWQLVKTYFPLYSLYKYTSMEVDLSFYSSWPVVGSQHSSLVQCIWPCAPRRVSLSDKYNQGHPLAPSL